MKKSQLILSLLISFFLVASLSAQSFQTGKYSANYKSNGYALNTGEGPRTHSIEVRFEKPFETTPEIIVTVSHVNADTKDGVRIRYNVETKAVSRDGFILELSTWDDSKIHELRGNWLAISN